MVLLSNPHLLPISHLKWMVIYPMVLLLLQPIRDVVGGEKLALLSATLRTYQKAACDSDQVIIACPRGTSISIEFAQYNNFENKDGFSIDDLCPLNNSAKKVQSKAKHLLRGSTFGTPGSKIPTIQHLYGQTTELPSSSLLPDTLMTEETEDAGVRKENASNVYIKENDSSENCMWPNALQYSLLQTVVEACQKKKHCKFNGAPHFYRLSTGVDVNNYNNTVNTVNVDPCHKRRKIVEVAYKCRPYEFRSKVACHNDMAQLECNPYSRIAVYSASFGRTEYESIQCPQPQGVREETCQASYATETVMQICHGRRRCNLAADANTFGSPCQPMSKMYLKVVYTCDSSRINPIMTHSADLSLEDNQERLYLYLLIAGLIGVIICIIIVSVHVWMHKSQALSSETQMASVDGSGNPRADTTIPNGFNDTISEIDAEIDMPTTISVPSVSKNENYISYGSNGGLYNGLGSSSRLQNSSTSVLQDGASIPPTGIIGTSAPSTIITNPGVCGVRQSPDIIGITSKSHLAVPPSGAIGYQTGVGGILAPTIVIGSNGSSISNSLNCGPMTSIGQYTTAPTIRASYIINAEGMLKRPPNLQTPPMTGSTTNSQYSTTSTLRRIKTTDPSAMQQQLSYDGTAPRTLSTGVPVNSQFYYG
ncbi:uncharacterized protein LOC126763529 isoform X4 [Bactrocera neohumeralis]|uniref:uncharacterized protein LOC120774627 isoform X4 n=1 Tax=Bactrocera tryoni TaxID=59916 RepID=UPI001A96218F|nr:uncharacterized protein LOC120774627 isoform X4 [Bactrocera tryoni]XP_050337167.1 uncharacterized protein LOC126763529 isoform X4 [Bactrocera neohumeralis]